MFANNYVEMTIPFVTCTLQHVRRAAVLALSTAAHNKPNLIKGLLPELLPLLYDQTVVKVSFPFFFCLFLISTYGLASGCVTYNLQLGSNGFLLCSKN